MVKIRLIRSDAGSVTVEYSLVGGMFLLLMIGMFEIAALFFVQASLQAAVNEAARFGRTGVMLSKQSQEDTVRAIIKDMTYGVLDTSKLHIRIAPVANFRSAAVSEVEEDSIDFGSANEPMVYTVTYEWPMAMQVVMAALDSSKTYKLTASTVIMNEPFPGEDDG